MSAVLDTHTVLWYLENSKELSTVARATIEEAVRNANALENIPRSVVSDMRCERAVQFLSGE